VPDSGLLEEIIIGDVMMSFGYKLNEILQMGYFEVYRLWTICDEINAKNLQNLSVIIDNPHSSEDRRKEVFDWLYNRQPRTKKDSVIPQSVLDKFAQEFKRG